MLLTLASNTGFYSVKVTRYPTKLGHPDIGSLITALYFNQILFHFIILTRLKINYNILNTSTW